MANENNNGQGVHHGTVENDHTKPHMGGGNLMAIFAYLGILIIIPFLTDSRKDPFVKYHLKQGLALLIFDAIGWVIAIVIGWVPVIGPLLSWIWTVASIVLAIVGIINVLQGQEKELLIVGAYARSFNF